MRHGPDTFAEIDTDNNGTLSREEFQEFFEGRDADRNGVVTKAEFGPRNIALFNKADVNRDGVVTRAEIGQLFDKMDRDHDGVVTQEEFNHAIEAKPKALRLPPLEIEPLISVTAPSMDTANSGKTEASVDNVSSTESTWDIDKEVAALKEKMFAQRSPRNSSPMPSPRQLLTKAIACERSPRKFPRHLLT